MKVRSRLIIIMLSVGFFIRLAGIHSGLPGLFHPDEARVILDTLSMGHRMTLLPERPDYALLYRYVLLFLIGLYFVVGKVAGVFATASDFAFRFMADPSVVFLLGRTLSVVCGIAIAVAAYAVSRRLFKDTGIAFCALSFCLFEFQMFVHSQYSIYPIFLCLSIVPAFYYLCRLTDTSSLRVFRMTGICLGLAVAIQNQAIYLLPSLAVALAVNLRRFGRQVGTPHMARAWVQLFLCLALFSLIGNFYWFFVFQKSMGKTLELMGVTRVGFSSIPPYAYHIVSMAWWVATEIIRQDIFLGVLMIAGCVYAVYRRSAYDMLFLAFLTTTLLVTSSWGFRSLHDIILVMPVLCIFAGRFLIEAIRPLKRKTALAASAVCLAVLPLAGDAIVTDMKKMNQDTREVAALWVEGNIPSGAQIAVDWPLFSVPLGSDTPLLFRNPVAERYYRLRMPDDIRQRYEAFSRSRVHYVIHEALITSDEPLWPAEMPLSVRQQIESKHVYRDLYSRFIFKTLDELRREGAEYLIITSHAWGYFLLDGDPYKKGLLNAFIKDRPERNYRHADHFIDDHRHGPLYYLAKQGRSFYEPLLQNEAEGAVLIKEFSPSALQLGPYIRIYKLLPHE